MSSLDIKARLACLDNSGLGEASARRSNMSDIIRKINTLDTAIASAKCCKPWAKSYIRQLEAKRRTLLEAFDLINGFDSLGAEPCRPTHRRTCRRTVIRSRSRKDPSYVPPKHLAEGSVLDDLTEAWNSLW